MRRFRFSIIVFLVVVLGAMPCFAAPVTTSSTTAQTIITRSRYLLNEATASFWSDTELLTYVNEGQVDIATRALCIQTYDSITLASNTVEYTPSVNYIKVLGAYYVDSAGAKYQLQEKSINESVEAYHETIPAYYYDFGGKLGVFPPLTSATTQYVKFFMAMKPTSVGLSDNVTVPAIYDNALIYYVCSKALLRDRQFGKAAYMMQRYNGELDRFRIDFGGEKK